MKDSKILCPRTGGYRQAYACCVLDRYRRCRKKCKTLADYLITNPETEEKAKEYIAKKRKKDRNDHTGWLFKASQYANKGLPNTDLSLKCTRRGCNFVAKSQRGLKAHMTRTHGVKRKRVA